MRLTLKDAQHDDMDHTSTNSQRSQCPSDCSSGKHGIGKDAIGKSVRGSEPTAFTYAVVTPWNNPTASRVG